MAGHSLDDLRRVIRRIETRRPKRPAPQPIEEVLGGEVVDTGEGKLLVVRREFPLSHQHGRQTLGAVLEAPLDLLSAVARAERPVEDARRLLFLDAETTGLAGGTGTYAFLVGAAWLEDDRLVLTQHFMRDFDEEAALLAALRPLLERASGLVTFNGAGFDVPFIRGAFPSARLPPAHLDLLTCARRLRWRGGLKAIERQLGLSRDLDVRVLAGSDAVRLWRTYERTGSTNALRLLVGYNRADCENLEPVAAASVAAMLRRLAPPARGGIKQASLPAA